MIKYKRYKIDSPSYISVGPLGIQPDYKQQCINEIYRLGDSMKGRSNVQAAMSTWQIWNESNVFNQIFDFATKVVIQEYVYDERSIINLHSAWSAVYKKGNYTKNHNHEPCWMSFVYYLQASGETPLIFEGNQVTEHKPFTVKPEDDTLVLFPAYMRHKVPIHDSETDRICLAGNFVMEVNDEKRK